ncbi:hypothetical protein BH10ACI1_BH10ACI1_17150 [soil metagenome]
MAYCYECGSQVAENDLFCPYCGISVKAPTGKTGDDFSMENTMVIKNDQSVKSPEPSVSSNEEIANFENITTASDESKDGAKKIDEEAETLKEFGKSTADFSNSNTEESIKMKTESVEIPAEMLQSEEIVEVPADVVEKDSNFEIEDIQKPAEANLSENSDLEEPEQIELLKPIINEPEISLDEPNFNDLNPQKPDSESTSDEHLPQNELESDVSDISNDFIEDGVQNQENDSISYENNEESSFPIEAFDIDYDEANKEIAETLSTDQEINESLAQTADETLEDSKLSIESPTEKESNEENVKSDSALTLIQSPQNPQDVQILDEPSIANFDASDIEKSEKIESQPLEITPSVESEPIPDIQESFAQPNEFNEEKESISKPEIEFEESKPASSAAVFDSVQIVQDVKKEDNFEDKVAAAEAEKKSNESLAENSSEKESRSYTTPNIGVENTDGKKNAKLKPLEEGTVLNNRYEIVRKIGGGGMGAVYLASDKNLGGVLRAVKEMVQSYIEEIQQDKAVSDFKRESLLLTSLEHPAIPTIYDYFFDEKEMRFYLVMKYISGGDLAGRLRASTEGKIDEKTVTEWGIQIADVLDYLHNRQPAIVYRDLKPANIMIDGNSGRLMLIDFGIARWINKEEKGVTAVGTMGYAPPELFSGNVESRSDIYSLGSTMFHLLTGADPQSNPLLIFDFQKNPFPRQINPALSDQMERILMKSVEYNAEKRFESAADLKKSLEEHLENLKVGKVTFGVKETPKVDGLSESLVFCGFCGQKIIASDVFCAFCGSQQPFASQQSGQSVPYILQTAAAKLTLLNSEEFETPSFALENETNVIGRRDPMSNIFPEVDLSRFDPQTKISRRHARIWRDGNIYMVEDLGSSNGTVLQPVMSESIRLLPHQPHILTNGDKIKVGDTTMGFIIG